MHDVVHALAPPRPLSAGVTSLSPGQSHRDPECAITRFVLAAGEVAGLAGAEHHRFVLIESGDLHYGGEVARPGALLVVAARRAVDAVAGRWGARGFVCTVRGLDSVPRAGVLTRRRLAPFPDEQIVVSTRPAFAFGGVFNLAEVLVPPGVTTSQHALGVRERYLMMSGPATMFFDDEAVSGVGAGDVVAVPAGRMQSIRNEGPAALRFYCLCTPPFTSESYRAGRRAWRGPEGFELESWWRGAAVNYR